MSTASKNPRFTLTRPLCSQCVKLQEEVKRLREENDRLKAQIRYQQRKIDEGYFGSSTPSAKKPFKANTKAERNNGGGRVGHRGHGRTTIDEREADEVIVVDTTHVCPGCHVALESVDLPDRTVIEVEPVQVKKVLFKLTKRRCPQCRRVFRAKAPGVLPKCKQGNSLLAHVATEHYLHQVTLGSLSQRLGIGESSLIEAMHHLARLFKEVPQRLIAEYRQAPVKHADETGWPNDGRNGYAWLFCTPTISIFRLRLTRAASVAKEVLGTEPLPGTLVVDRYNAYNKILCAIQYCYSHLLREVQDVGKEFPDSQEVQDFVGTTAPLLSQAMQLRRLPISDNGFYARADQLKMDIQQVMHSQARHAGIQKIQNIFRENAHRMYHWAQDRAIPADNNFTEREFRKLVIARKISFGSQSDAGAQTREILMTVLLTLKKRKPGDVRANFKACLDALAPNPKQDPYQVLFSLDSS
jgi:transposase